MQIQNVDIPCEAPVMVLPNALLPPLAVLPLSIFEQRYRRMLAHALEFDRMFCIALMKPGVIEATQSGDFYSTVGIGLIRACVGLDDGTSNLILQGLQRVEITRWIQEKPFRVAQIRPLSNVDGETLEAETLAAKVRELCGELEHMGVQPPAPIAKKLESILDPSALGDIVSHCFVKDPFARQQLLEELSVPTRLRRLLTILRQEKGE